MVDTVETDDASSAIAAGRCGRRHDGKAFGSIKNGEKEGLLSFYDDTGQLRRKGEFVNGVKEGPWVEFNGVVDQEATGTFKNSVKVNNTVPNNFAKSLTNHVSNYCGQDRCTEPITNLKIGLFSFDALDCTIDTRRDCYSLVFGVPGNTITIDKFSQHYSTYRVLNGPLPINLQCVDGITFGFQDAPDFSKMDGFYGIEWFKDRDYQRREKIYYKNDRDQTFPFFSEHPTTIGVLVNTHSTTGYSSSITYLFDTLTGEAIQLKGDCGGPVE